MNDQNENDPPREEERWVPPHPDDQDQEPDEPEVQNIQEEEEPDQQPQIPQVPIEPIPMEQNVRRPAQPDRHAHGQIALHGFAQEWFRARRAGLARLNNRPREREAYNQAMDRLFLNSERVSVLYCTPTVITDFSYRDGKKSKDGPESEPIVVQNVLSRTYHGSMGMNTNKVI